MRRNALCHTQDLLMPKCGHHHSEPYYIALKKDISEKISAAQNKFHLLNSAPVI